MSALPSSLGWGIRPLVLCILLWIAGNAWGSMGSLSLICGLCGGAGSLGYFLWLWRHQWLGWSLFVCLAWFFLGVSWGAWDLEQREQQSGAFLAQYLNQRMWAEGWIWGSPSYQVTRPTPTASSSSGHSSSTQHVTHCTAPLVVTRIAPLTTSPAPVRYSGVKNSRFWPVPRGLRWVPVQAKLWLKVRNCHHLQRGSLLRLRMTLREPRFYGNPGSFDARHHWLQQGIRWHVSAQARDITVLGLRSEDKFWRAADQIRSRISTWIQQNTPKPEAAGLLLALLLGEKGHISQEVKQAFAQTGTSHLLAISGLHLAIVCSLLWVVWRRIFSFHTLWLMMGLPHRLAACFALPGVFAYAWLSGASVSTQRALVMVCFFLLATIFLRYREMGTTLSCAAFVILLIQPTAWSSLSFQLSFGAVIALWGGHVIMNANTDDEILAETFTPPTFLQTVGHWLLLAAWTSALAALATLPLTLQLFPQVPVWSPLVNVVAIPLGGYLVVGIGLLAVGVWCVSPWIASWILAVSAWFADLLLIWVQLCSRLPGSTLTYPPFLKHEWLSYYLALAAVLTWRKFRNISWWLGFSAIAIWATGAWIHSHSSQKTRHLQVFFLDVGQGDAALLRFPGGTTMLVDAGGAPFGDWDIGENVLLPTLRAMRISRIDIAVLSHPHPDHFDGFRAVAQHLPIGEFWHTGLDSHHPKFVKLMQILKQRKIRLRVFPKPQTLHIDGASVDILHPFPGPYEGTTYYWVLHANDNSLVMRIRWGQVRLLFTGDIEERGEQLLTQRWPDLRADVLKVPHHGSRTSSSDLLLNRVKPQHALFGMGRGNTFGFPHPTVLHRYQSRNIKMWRTDLHGMITVQTDGKSVQLHPYLKYHP